MPISAEDTFEINFRINGHNQTAPLFLSNKGRIIFCKDVFEAKFKNGIITLENEYGNVEVIEAGKNLREAYDYAAHNLYTFEKRVLPIGKWKAPNGEIFEGDKTIIYPAPLEVVPYFEKI